ncbi:FAD/NAD(P)-binding domain-containing protein [Penicillium chermesinum]|nr:FAD/NAD(P)-binding domain-containing protein [Penicillium chermesinum]
MSIKSVAVVGAGASGAITAAALVAEKYYDRIRVFERRETAGGTWIFDADPGPLFDLMPGKKPPDVDPPLELPKSPLPRLQRYELTPIYEGLTFVAHDTRKEWKELRIM